MTRFADILLEAISVDTNPPALEDPSNLTRDDWDELISDAIKYRLAYQLSEYLKSDPGRCYLAPRDSLVRLNNSVRWTTLYNLRQQFFLRRVLLACQEAEVQVILLKGLWLIETAYQNNKARMSGDIDLLIKPEQMQTFTAIARGLGFTIPARIKNICDLATEVNEYSLVHPDYEAYFDIHWSLTHPADEAAIDEEELWINAEPFLIAGTSCLSLKLEDHLLYLCFHTAIHHRFIYVGPRALLDIASLISTPPREINWTYLSSKAHTYRWQRGVWLSFELTRRYLGAKIPAPVMEHLKTWPDSGHDETIIQTCIEAIFLDQQPDEGLSENLIHMLDEPSLLLRIRYLLKKLFASRAHAAMHLKVGVDSHNILWLYGKRLFLLFRNHVPKLMQVALSNRARLTEIDRARRINEWLGK